ncbi:LysR family transcriptional regulator [Elioraea rosea]|uniref:LysR family transcriptional regulator n=1 Tax=Elioraea rosea TaxID=2492390 RepID=UPI0013150DBF|nr:LysR family transcriptional regulator [Elioraea rosea]
MSIQFDLHTLRLFVSVCETGSITKAAGLAHLAVSAVSRRLENLADGASAPLFRRRPHGVEPTAAGLALLRYARDVLSLSERLAFTLAEHRSGIRGHVRVVASSTALARKLALDLSRFIAANDGIRVDLDEEPSVAGLEALRSRRADAAVIVDEGAGDDLTLLPYTEDRLVVILPGSHPLAKMRSIKFADAAKQDTVTLDANSATYRLLARKAAEAGLTLRVRVQARSFDTICHIAAQGLGIGILPEHAARPLAIGLGLRQIPLSDSWANRRIVIAISRDEEPAAPLQRLLNALEEDATRAPRSRRGRSDRGRS